MMDDNRSMFINNPACYVYTSKDDIAPLQDSTERRAGHIELVKYEKRKVFRIKSKCKKTCWVTLPSRQRSL